MLFLSFFTTALMAKTVYYHKVLWENPPTLLVCKNARIPKKLIETAVAYWMERDQYVDIILYDRDCENLRLNESITFHDDFLQLTELPPFAGEFERKTVGKLISDEENGFRTAATIYMNDKHRRDQEAIIVSLGMAFGIVGASDTNDPIEQYQITYREK